MRTDYRIVAALCGGVLIGAVSMGIYHKYRSQAQADKFRLDLKRAVQQKSDAWAFEVYTSHIIYYVNSLTALQRGETNRIQKNMERDLNSELYALQASFPFEILSSNAGAVRILKAAAHDRAENPFKSGNDAEDSAVERLLANFQN